MSREHRDRRARRPSPFAPPRKRLGQHFLERAWVATLVDAARLGATDTCVEIGPGRGALTLALAPRVGRLVCVEIDAALAAALAERLPSHAAVVHGDFLETAVASLADMARRLPLRADTPADTPAEPVQAARADAVQPSPDVLPLRVIGNLPYNVSSPILFKLLREAADGRTIADATLMLQQEVADRLMAAPGSRTYGTLAVQVARVADVERLLTLPPGAFRPPPKVTSALVRLAFRPPAVDVGDPAVFERIVRGIFLQRRKTVQNALVPVAASLDRTAAYLLTQADIDPTLRPEQLTLEDFARLSRAVL
jgi:16S rRNA (adenine1518-N6/adenine1519-N6)-dimethyltransferase